MRISKDNEKRPQDPSDQVITTLARAAEARSSSCGRRLDPESDYSAVQESVLVQPFAKIESHEGKYKEGLSHIIIIGSTVLGVSRGISAQKDGGSDVSVDFIRLAILPVGPGESSTHSATTIADIDVPALSKPDTRGVVNPRQIITVGRQDVTRLTGYNDTRISREHLKITIHYNGNVTIEDMKSTNGTQVLSNEDLMSNIPGLGLEEEAAIELNELALALEAHPSRWSRQSADKVVIEDAQ